MEDMIQHSLPLQLALLSQLMGSAVTRYNNTLDEGEAYTQVNITNLKPSTKPNHFGDERDTNAPLVTLELEVKLIALHRDLEGLVGEMISSLKSCRDLKLIALTIESTQVMRYRAGKLREGASTHTASIKVSFDPRVTQPSPSEEVITVKVS